MSTKPKSPATPSRTLGDSVADVKKLYNEFSHSNFSKSEIASKLGVSATSGPFAARLFTLKEFGLIDQNRTDYAVSDSFKKLNGAQSGDATFKRTALAAVRRSTIFRELLDEYKTKLPSIELVAGRLETQRRFNAQKAKAAAEVLEKSLRYAGVLDGSNNILPVRDTAADSNGDPNQPQDPTVGDEGNNGQNGDPLPPDTLSMEIPVGEGRKVVVRYPRDLSAAEAKKVGNVLNAIVT